MGQPEPLPASARIELADEPDFDLGGMTVKPAERVVVIGGKRRELQPRVMQVLVALSRARPGVVSRDKLAALCWNDRVVGDDALNRCILALRRLADESAPKPFTLETVPRVGHRLVEQQSPTIERAADKRTATPLRAMLYTASAAGVAAAAFFLSQPGLSDTSPPTVLITAAGDPQSRELARELGLKLAGMEPLKFAPVQIVSPGGLSRNADLVLKVERALGSPRGTASAALTSTADRTLLWTQEFENSRQGETYLGQRIALAVTGALRCSAEAFASETPLGADTLKGYVNVCSELSDHQYDRREAVQLLREIVSRSPKFANGWAKLLQAETETIYSLNYPDGEALKAALPGDILSARKLQPHLAEAYLAQYALTPPRDFIARSRLVDEAVARNPHHAGARAARSGFLAAVGRLTDSRQDARRALKLDPSSPDIRAGYITTLAVTGQSALAQKQLVEAERFWPGASSLAEARYLINLRFRDPREALGLLRAGPIETGGAAVHEALLEARINPTPARIKAAIERAQLAYANEPRAIFLLLQTLAEFDRKEDIFELLLNWRRPDLADHIADVIFRPAFLEVHKDPRFMLVAQRIGLASYWSATGHWPDFCFVPGLRYDCRALARRIDGPRES